MSGKRLRNALVAALAVAALAVAGCGGGAANDKEIKVGGNFELTGGVANLGKQTVNGINLAFNQANASGGILGKQIKLVTADNKSEVSESINAITKLINQDKVVAVLGPVASSSVIASLQVATDNKVAVITATGTNERVTTDEKGATKRYGFRACFIDPFQGTVMAKFAGKSLNAKSAAIYVDNSSDYAKGLAKAFEETFKNGGGKIAGTEAYLQKDTDFKATLTKIKAMNADVIFVPGYYEEVGRIIRQARELGITAPIIGGDGWDDPKVVEIAGKEAINNTYFSNHYSPDDKDPLAVNFAEAYKKEYGQPPSAFAALGYDAALMLIDAIKRAGTTNPDKIRDALEQTKDLKVVSGVITLDAKHNPIKSAVVIEFKDGKQVFKEKIAPAQ
jgi:branched-chain amino acid transport system substrate-binding protein